jgi:ubiquinone/menaquinone biosynthesis C-methylase UbiE
MTEPFDDIAEAYDRWYDEPEGRAILKAELACLRRAAGGFDGRWLEVGVGTGRFASNLGIGEGVDPSGEMLRLASVRGIQATPGKAESLSHGNDEFDGVLMALALCFILDAKQALRECWRVLLPAGTLLLGVVPADSPWGEAYEEKKATGHPVYRHAVFRTTTETIQLAEEAGFVLQQTASTLFSPPDGAPENDPRVKNGNDRSAGFVALRFMKNGDKSNGRRQNR